MFGLSLLSAVLCSFCCRLIVAFSNEGSVTEELRIVKRHDLDYPMCLNAFDIHQDKIIRTQDSRAMGAKYINERDVASREECLRLCCETPDCDVFVFEEKNPGSCYLFQCGTPEDFKCKFTKHRNYTSAVLSSTRHMSDLESQIKLTQHEHELSKLRNSDVISSEATIIPPTESTTTLSLGSKEIAQVVPTSSNTENEAMNHHCSRYQFECRTSGECIAIYNACDGIPQCADGSDEAIELGCPVQLSTQPPLAKSNPAPGENIVVMPPVSHRPIPAVSTHGLSLSQSSVNQQPPTTLSENNQLTMPVLSKQYKSNQWSPQMYSGSLENQHVINPNYLPNAAQQNTLPMSVKQQIELQQIQSQQNQELAQPQLQLVNQAKMYGREGEGLLYHTGGEVLQWPSSYQQEANTGFHSANNGNSQIFSHKGNGLVSQSDSNNGQYDPTQNDFSRYNYYENSAPYRGIQGQLQNNWQMMHKSHDTNSMNNNLEENINIPGANVPQNILPSGPGQDYYYEESFRTRVQPQMIPQRIASHSQQIINSEVQKDKTVVQHIDPELTLREPISENTHTDGVSVKKAEVHHPTIVNITTEKPKEMKQDHHHNSHRKMEQLTAELTLSETNFDSDIDQQNVSPRGAILSLTMGMCVTGIMLVLVGCRMRMVRRRLRRGTKSPYAHDADFLVNGMYL